MPLFDTHCHYNLEPLTTDWQNHWQQARAAGVSKSLIVGTTLTTSQLALQQAQKETDLYASLGIHPGHSQESTDFATELRELTTLAADQKVIAIGEVGLDYYHLPSNTDNQRAKDIQEQVFLSMLNLAAQAKLPLILHVRDRDEAAYWRTLELLEEHWSMQQALIFHCVSGPLEYIKRALSLPKSYFGFDGNLTFKNAHYQREIFDLVKKTDPSKILLETDAPYLAPEPHRGQVCEPKMVMQTAYFAQEKLGLDLDLTYQNSLRAFNLL